MALLRFVELLACLFLLSVLGQVAESRDVTVCDKPADIIFVLDASSTMQNVNFRKQLKFVASIIDDLAVDPLMVRCGLVTYSDEARQEFGLRKYSTAEEAMKAVASVHQKIGNTRTDLAINRLRQMMTEDKRPGVPQIGILLTDGLSDYPALTRNEAELARNEGIIMFAVGIGLSINQAELSAIASREDYKYSVDDFDGLVSIRDILREETCVAETPNDQPIETEECPDKLADIMFVVDESSSISNTNFKRQKDFLNEMVALFQVSETGTHVGVITFGNKAVSRFGLDRYYTVAEVQSAINRTVQENGRTNTADGIRYAREISFAKSRAGAMKIAVVITDGKSNEPESTAKEASLLKEDGVTVFAIGVGFEVVKTELHAIASSPLDKHVFMVESYEALESVKKELMSNACLNKALNQERSVLKDQRPWSRGLRMLQLLSGKD